jgi:hypothetical protein
VLGACPLLTEVSILSERLLITENGPLRVLRVACRAVDSIATKKPGRKAGRYTKIVVFTVDVKAFPELSSFGLGKWISSQGGFMW